MIHTLATIGKPPFGAPRTGLSRVRHEPILVPDNFTRIEKTYEV